MFLRSVRALVIGTALAFAVACGGPSPAGEDATGPRRLDEMPDQERRAIFDEIIECENEGLRVAAAEVPELDPTHPAYDAAQAPALEARRFATQHHAEAACKLDLQRRHRVSEQQINFLRTYGMGQRWFTSHAGETLGIRVPLGKPVD